MSRLWIAAVLFGLPVLASTPTLAQDCTDATQIGLDECAGATYQKEDAELNAVYGKIVARLGTDAATKASLVKAQKAWIAFRDAECAFRSSGTLGGSIHPMAVALCLADVTRQRVSELRPLLACQEGDTTCPVPAAP